MAASVMAACAPPADYGELFIQYGEKIRRVVWRQLGPSARREDVDDGVSYIFQQFVKNDVLEQYRPDHISDFTGQPVKPEAFIMAKVPLYCRGLREHLARQGREALTLDAPACEDGSATVLDLMAGTWDEYPSLAASDVLEWLRAALEARSPQPGCRPVLPLFDALAERFREGKSVTAAAVRSRFGLDKADAEAWFAELREALREAAGEQRMRVPDVPAPPAEVLPEPAPAAVQPDPAPELTFELGGLVLTSSEVQAAIDAQENARGNRVLPAFKDTGHPLANSGKIWYLEFADQVMAQYPETRRPKGGHYAGGHFGKVKAALIYGMKRMLDPAPAAAPEPPAPAAPEVPEVWRELKSVLARLPGATAETAEAAMEAASLLLAAA